MIEIKSEIFVKGIKSNLVCNFFINCTDNDYKKWWSGIHLMFHTIKQKPNIVGNVVYIDEYIGKFRFKSKAVIIKYLPEKEIIYQIIKFVKMPVFLQLKFEDSNKGVNIKHIIIAGIHGAGKIFDFIFRLYLSKKFIKAMDEHANIEFQKLKDIIK